MKRLVIMMIASMMTLMLSAQSNQIYIVEDFENGSKLEWLEVYTKNNKHVANVQNGAFVLKGFLPYTATEVKQINPNTDYAIKASLTIPKLDKKNWFGIVYNPIRAENGLHYFPGLLFHAGQAVYTSNMQVITNVDKKDNKYYRLWPQVDKKKIQNIQLAPGKNVPVSVEIVRRGSEVFFYINEVEVAVVEAENFGMFATPREALAIGFYTTALELRIEEVIISQEVSE